MVFGSTAFEKGIAFPISTDIGGLERGLMVAGSKIADFSKVALVSIGLVAGAMGAIGVHSVSVAANFEKSMAEVFTLIPSASEEMKDSLVSDAKEIGKEFGFLSDTTIPAMYQAISGGVPPDNVLGFMQTASKAAIAGVTDVNTAVDGLTSVVNAYGEDVISAEKASDILFSTVRLGKTTFPELAANISKVTPTASNLGIGFDSVAAAMSTITAQTGNTARASTSLNSMLAELGKTGQKGFEAFKQASGKTFPEFIAAGGNLSDAIQTMEKYSKRSGISLLDMFGGMEAGQAAMQLTGSGTKKFASDLKEMESASGATDIAFETMSNTFDFQMNRIKAQFDIMFTEIGEKLIPMIKPILDELLPMFTAFGGWILEWVDRIIGVFGLVSEEMGTFEGYFKQLSDWFMGVVTRIGEIWDENGELISGVIGMISDAIVWLVENVVVPYLDWSNERTGIMAEFWEENGDLIIAALENIGKFIMWLINDIILPLWEWAWPYISQILDDQLAVVLDVVKVFAALFAGDWEALGDALVDLTGSVMDLMFSVISFGFDAIIGLGYILGDIMLGIFTALWNGVLGVTEGALNAIVDKANEVAQSAGSLLGFENVPQIARISLGRATAPTMQDLFGAAPTLSGMMGGRKPSDIIEALRNAEPEVPDVVGWAQNAPYEVVKTDTPPAVAGQAGIVQNITINAKEIDSPADTARSYKRAGLELATGAYGGH